MCVTKLCLSGSYVKDRREVCGRVVFESVKDDIAA